MISVSLCAETLKPVSEGTKSDGCGKPQPVCYVDYINQYGYHDLRALKSIQYVLNAFTTGNPFWGHIYLNLVQGGIWGL